ncbi:MAG: sigma-70 factor domain-containing protein, partial [Cyanobacteriota bacterium]
MMTRSAEAEAQLSHQHALGGWIKESHRYWGLEAFSFPSGPLDFRDFVTHPPTMAAPQKRLRGSCDAIATHLRNVARIPLLRQEEEITLARQVQALRRLQD